MRVVNISSPHTNAWLRQFPHGKPEWNGWRFVFNQDTCDYDYLVAFDDLHAITKLRCRPENTIHLATEPPSVHSYDAKFLGQFSWILSQDTRVDHPGVIHGQPGLTWFIGWKPGSREDQSTLNFEQLYELFDLPKTKLLSVIASNKDFTPEHAKRLHFAKKLKEHYGEKIDFFGRGFNQMDDKLDALRDYRFNVVLENSSTDHYFSEKFTDCVIAGTYPLYCGCPNLDQYFPEGSFLRIDIENFEKSILMIDAAIADGLDKENRNELRLARDLAMHKHNIFPMLVDLIEGIEAGKYGPAAKPVLLDDSLLPFGSERYKTLLTPAMGTSFRSRLNSLANSNPFFAGLRTAYRTIRGRS